MSRYNTSEKTGVGPRVRKFREDRGWTQDELAKKLFIQRTALSMKESGSRDFRPEELLMLSEIFEVTVDELLTGVQTKSWSIHKDLGLDDSAIESFRFFANKYPAEYQDHLNKALSSPCILEALAEYMSISHQPETGRYLETSYSYDEKMYVCKMTPSVFDSVVSYNLLTLLEAVRSGEFITMSSPLLTKEQADIVHDYLRGGKEDAKEK